MKKLLLLLASMSVVFSSAIFAADTPETQDSATMTTSVVLPSSDRVDV